MPVRFRILPAPEELRAGWARQGASGMAEGPADERTFEITTELDEIRIGRQPAVEIELPFPGVSSFHARLFRGDLPGDWWVEDLGSTNGTWVDGSRLSPRRPVPIRAGQRLRLATVDIVFEGWSATARGAESTATLARRLISDLFGVVGGDAPTLTIESGPGHPISVRLAIRDRRYLVGRAEGGDLVLGSEHVSREHAAFVRSWDGVVASDLGSRNGVLVNGRAIVGATRIADGDRIEVGPIVLRLADPEDRYLRRTESLEADSSAEAAAATASVEPIVSGGTGAGMSGGAADSGGVAAGAPPVTHRPTPMVGESMPGEDAASPSRPVTSRRWLVSAVIGTIVVVAIACLIMLLVGTR